MSAPVRDAAACLLALALGSIAAFMFFSMVFVGASFWQYAVWAAAMIASVAALSGIRRGTRQIVLFCSLPGLLSSAFLTVALLTSREGIRVWHYLFWPGYAVLHYSLTWIGTGVGTRVGVAWSRDKA